MNNIIKKQLENIKVANLPDWDNNTTHLIIKKGQRLDSEAIQINHYYLVELADYVINEPEGFSLSSNWNNGITPKDKTMKCCVTSLMGNMVKIDGVGFDIANQKDLNSTFSGWIPKKAIKIKNELL